MRLIDCIMNVKPRFSHIKYEKNGGFDLFHLIDESIIARDTEINNLLKGKQFNLFCHNIFFHSPFLKQIIITYFDDFLKLLIREPEILQKEFVFRQAHYVDLLCDSFSGSGFISTIKKELRINRKLHALFVALCDLTGYWNIERITLALSDFADASVQTAFKAAFYEHYHQKFKIKIALETIDICDLVVLALGKHGAQELNYSSDIDLIIFFKNPTVPLLPNNFNEQDYIKIAQRLAQILQERTPEGFVHRVDYRLRPDPASTQVAVSFASAHSYYENVGQNWERAAFIKARPVAGNLQIGKEFVKDLKPFIWRKYFDFSSISEIHLMKKQIHSIHGFEERTLSGANIKLGYGGIREIEFFVQAQQLIFGGKNLILRGMQTIPMLYELEKTQWISKRARNDLTEAYNFLRLIEHRLQMVRDEQTQCLPIEKKDLLQIARFCGFSNLSEFRKIFFKHTDKVRHHYSLLFKKEDSKSKENYPLIFQGQEYISETVLRLKNIGFRRPEAVIDIINDWKLGKRRALISSKAREVLNKTITELLEALGKTANPEAALSILDQAFLKMPASVELLTILHSHETLRSLFADLLGSAPRLAQMVMHTPHILDCIIDPAFLTPIRHTKSLEKQIRYMMGDPTHFEAFLDIIRDTIRQFHFLTGARLLSGLLSPDDLGHVYSGMAEAAIRITFEQVLKEFSKEYGEIQNASFAILGLGRLGSRQMTARSDLDLIMIYDFSPEYRESTGNKKVDVTTYTTRLTQRLIAALSVPTRRGELYEVDLRLRPQGGKGPIAVQVSSFFSYQEEESDLWEHMALTRARVITGDLNFSKLITQEIRKIIKKERSPPDVIREARKMRSYIATHKGDKNPWNFKLARGAILDLDFLAQTIVLIYSIHHPRLLGQRTPRIFQIAMQKGIITESEAEILQKSHGVFYALQQWQRTIFNEDYDDKKIPEFFLYKIASFFGLADSQSLFAYIKELQEEAASLVSMIWDRIEKEK